MFTELPFATHSRSWYPDDGQGALDNPASLADSVPRSIVRPRTEAPMARQPGMELGGCHSEHTYGLNLGVWEATAQPENGTPCRSTGLWWLLLREQPSLRTPGLGSLPSGEEL